ncbi:MAG: hypothetical protein ACFBRM_03750 [Pikeienuella sp.]
MSDRCAGWVAVPLALAACAQQPPPEQAPPEAAAAVAPQPGPEIQAPKAQAPSDTTIGVLLKAPGSIARDRVERLAASCWLDDELGAEILLVDRRSGEITAVGGNGDLLRVAFAGRGPLETEVTLSGPALADPDRAERMAGALSRVLEGAEPAC